MVDREGLCSGSACAGVGWTLAPGWRMASVVAAAGAVALGVNLRVLGAGSGALEILSTAAAAFIVVLGLALFVKPERTE